jgi:hypothetical protein
MSSAAHFTGAVSESHSYQTQEIPQSLKSNNSAQSIRANNRHFQLATSSSSSQSSGGVLLWQIPPTNGAIGRETMYIRCRVTATNAAYPTYADAATTMAFKGPGAQVAGVKSDGTATAGSTISALSHGYSWIQRLTLYGTGSAVVDQMNYVNSTMDLLLAHNSNANWLTNEAQATLGVARPWDRVAATANSYIDLCLPLPLSCFNNSAIDFPLYLCRNPMTLQLDMASLARAITTGATTGCTEYTVSQAYLCYEVLEVPHSLIEAERSAVQGGHPFIMPLQSWLNVQVPQSVLSSYTLGLNASSLRSTFVSLVNAAAYAVGSDIDYVRDFSDSAAAGWGSGVNAQLFLDGNIKNSSIFDNPVQQFTQLKQALHNNIQSSVVQPSVSNFAAYLLYYFALGFDCTSFDDESTIFGGSPVSNLNIQITGLGANSTYIANVMCLYDTLLAFQQDGIMEVKR